MGLPDDEGSEGTGSHSPHHQNTPGAGGFLGTIGPDGFYGSGWEETLFGRYWEPFRRPRRSRRERRNR